ncbi:MAG TPA: nucleotidyltransferase family protein [Allosphingosinicella sp.]|jgi:hypothetical protein|uniref:nucleotidyltransferase domain-containing protein n=1 Tax=Allosphingosinicella sp. TaxID=2823234 RepID=UPI002F2873F8
MMKLSPEFLLAAACCRWPPGSERNRAVQAAATGVDWTKLLAVARRQRVEGLVNLALRQAAVSPPDEIAADLSRAAAEIARTNLTFVAESGRLLRIFENASIAALFVKGATLDMLAYGSIAYKRARDIDILIRPEQLLAACTLLLDAGYQRVVPGPEIGSDRFERWVALCKETSWLHRQSGIIVEIHTGLVDAPELLAGIDADSPRQQVEVAPGLALPTLRTEELFAYLCVHGATHAWARLKWIADLGALLSRHAPDAIEHLYRASLPLNAGRPAAQALLLCHQLFATPLPELLLAELRSNPVNRRLVSVALGVMAGRRSGSELDDTILGTLPIHLSHFLLAEGWRYKGAELGRKLRSHEDQARIRLPRPLAFLYPVIAVPSWLWRRVKGPAPIH